MKTTKNKEYTKQELEDFLKKYSIIWRQQLNIEYEYRSKNVSTAFKGIGAFGELFAALYNSGFVGSGSGGLGFDLINEEQQKEIEVKTSSTFQSNKCDNCEFKFSKIFTTCSNCESDNFHDISDSRFSINAKSLLDAYDKKIISALVLFHIFDKPKSINLTTGEITFIVNCYNVPFNYDNSKKEVKRLQYFRNQKEQSKKSNCCNLLPCSYDFYLLSPEFFDSWEISFNFINLDTPIKITNQFNQVNKQIEVNISICSSKEEKDLFKKLSNRKNTLPLEVFAKNFEYRKKRFNKDRGKIKSVLG